METPRLFGKHIYRVRLMPNKFKGYKYKMYCILFNKKHKERLVLSFLMLLPSLFYGQVQHGNVDYKKDLHFQGNVFKFSQPFSVKIGGVLKTSHPTPVEINTEKIYQAQFITKPPVIKGYKSLSDYIRSSMPSTLAKLPDGNYLLDDYYLVINKQGKLVYFDFRPLTRVTTKHVETQAINSSDDLNKVKPFDEKKREHFMPLKKELIDEIENKLYQVLSNAPSFSPGLLNGVKVNCRLSPAESMEDVISVRNHKVTFIR